MRTHNIYYDMFNPEGKFEHFFYINQIIQITIFVGPEKMPKNWR